MTHVEAKALISMLSLAFPAARFSAENAELYARAIADLDSTETQGAVESLIRTAARMPTIAELRGEVMSARRERVRLEGVSAGPTPMRAPGRSGEPSAEEWGVVLGRLLESSARYRRMAEPWYREHGKAFPGDPSAVFVELARRGARGEDVLRLAGSVLGVPGGGT